jgi:enoyl-CoA hydratase
MGSVPTPAADAGVRCAADGPVLTLTLDAPARRNAVDGPMAAALRAAFESFEQDDRLRVAVLTGAGGHFCAGADLSALADRERQLTVSPDGTGPGPMGPSRMTFTKPVLAAVEGYAVAGGLELALMCDLRIAARSAVFGVFCRRFGVPLIDGGTVRLPRTIGMGRALDLILTGRAVHADEALQMGLANRVVDDGQALAEAQALAHRLAALPWQCLLADRRSAYAQWDLPMDAALRQEGAGGWPVIEAESRAGAARFTAGAGRHGQPV